MEKYKANFFSGETPAGLLLESSRIPQQNETQTTNWKQKTDVASGKRGREGRSNISNRHEKTQLPPVHLEFK